MNTENNSRSKKEKRKQNNVNESGDNQTILFQSSALKCIAILPGIGDFDDSCSSSDESIEIFGYKVSYDLLGRKIVKKKIKKR